MCFLVIGGGIKHALVSYSSVCNVFRKVNLSMRVACNNNNMCSSTHDVILDLLLLYATHLNILPVTTISLFNIKTSDGLGGTTLDPQIIIVDAEEMAQKSMDIIYQDSYTKLNVVTPVRSAPCARFVEVFSGLQTFQFDATTRS